ncbi:MULTISPECIES: DUF669 domain-containing protein [unclassified Mesorhizobium]|uniref:DUF669 domain-containing protein n=1 Tax=unclassified Mesorhizobium TaxID=325217 RepID=UPI00112D6923|nr:MULTISPECIES: DUF669 domain-containing protein [unclassified Mesorhizobium]TPK59060.1 hypothetical protein FJ551_25965 [Mesorhizobium sp. B2-5-1]TPL06659.1 hypothetical protein FJ944_22780 [Mesorhizobium sp. B2-4-11]
MANIAGGYDVNAEASGDFDPIPAGDYRAKIIESSIEEISGKENKGRCLKLTWQIETGPYDGRLIWDRLNMWAENMIGKKGDDIGKDISAKVVGIANSQFAAIREATGKMAPQDSTELHHIACTIKIAVKPAEGQYSASNVIKSVKPVGGAAGGAGASNGQQRFTPPANQAAAAQKSSAPWPRRQTA